MEKAYARYSAALLEVEQFLEDAANRRTVERYQERVLHAKEALNDFRALFFHNYPKIGKQYREFRVQTTRRVDTAALLAKRPELKDLLEPEYTVKLAQLDSWCADGVVDTKTIAAVVSEVPTQLKGGSAALR
jgi:hypothetical protein